MSETIQISTHKKSEFEINQITDLVMSAMGFLKSDTQTNRFKKYFIDTPDSIILKSLKDGILVGVLALRPLSYELSAFARAIAYLLDPSFLNNGYMIGYNAVQKQHQNRGINKRLFTDMNEKISPVILIAETKNPAGASSLSSSLSPLGYATFLNGRNITDENFSQMRGLSNIHVSAKANIMDNVRFPRYPLSSPRLISSSKIYPTIPNVEGFPQKIVHAFRPIIVKQMDLGKDKTAVGILISIKNI